MRFLFSVWLALVATVLLSTPVEAQRARARSVTREAVREFDRGNYAEARALFLEAHAIEPSSRLLRGAGMASFELREYTVAYEQLRAALAESRRALTPRQRRETEELLARTETFLGRFRVVVEPPDATVTIDLRPPELDDEDGSVRLAVGDHTITVSAEGYLNVDRRFTVRGGEDETLQVTLERDEPPNAAALGAPRPPVAPPPVVETSNGLAIGLVSAGGALVLGAVANLVWWLDRRDEVARCEDANGTPGARCLNLDTLTRQSRSAGSTTFLVGLTGLAMLTVGILRLTWDEGNDEEVACGVGGCTYRLRF